MDTITTSLNIPAVDKEDFFLRLNTFYFLQYWPRRKLWTTDLVAMDFTIGRGFPAYHNNLLNFYAGCSVIERNVILKLHHV